MTNMDYEIQNEKSHVKCRLMSNNDEICKCEISVTESTHTWDITAWFTKEGFKNKGFGYQTLKKALQYCMNTYGNPVAIEYTWNGANEYVMDWLETHFDAVCTCPIAVQKTQPGDDWDSHVYELNKDKVLKYFRILEQAQ